MAVILVARRAWFAPLALLLVCGATAWAAASAASAPAVAKPGAAKPVSPPAPAPYPFAGVLWDDGRAEYSSYRGTTVRYGQPRPTEARMVVVKEDLLRGALVKSDAGPVPGRTIEGIKLQWSADFPTGTYTYHQASTVMFDRATMAPLKQVMAHHELCGITFVRVGPENGRLTQHVHSYWEGEADRTGPVTFPPGEALWWDALPVSLRRWAGEAAPFAREVWVLPSQVSGRSPGASAMPVRATLRRVGAVSLKVPAGSFRAVEFRLADSGGADRFWFGAEFPHPLLKLETREGRSLELTRTQRLDYWNHHMNGDEKRVEVSPRP